jgi:uroporphyrinogen-III synthase
MITETMEVKKNLKRERILKAATTLFAGTNYHEVMVEDVAKLASIAKGTVYSYFSSKEELYYTILRLNLEKLLSSLKTEIEGEFNSIDAFKTFTSSLFDFMSSNNEFFVIYRKELLRADHELCREVVFLKQQLNNLLSEILMRGKKENFFSLFEDNLIADLLLGTIYGAIQRVVDLKYDPTQVALLKKELLEFLLYGILTAHQTSALPLKGKTIVLTRTVDQSKESAEVFIKLGADVIIFPTLDILPPHSWDEFDALMSERDKINFIIFTSSHSADMFLKRCADLNISFDFSGKKIVAVGNKTAYVCEKLGIPVHIIPKKFSGEGVVDELANYKIKNKIVFIPRSAIGRDDIPSGLEELGAILKTAPVYNIALPAPENSNRSLKKLQNNKPDIFIFTSPSTFKNFLEIVKPEDTVSYFKEYLIAAIGPTTKAAIESKDVKVDIIPDQFTIEGLSGAIVDFYKKKNRRFN